MSLIQQMRDHFAENRDTRFNNAALREALDNDDGQQISACLNQLHNAGDVKREKIEDRVGWFYWMPAGQAVASAGPLSPTSIAARLLRDRGIDRVQSDSTPTPKPVLPPPAKVVPADEVNPVFAIRNDGALGIDKDGFAISLTKPDVQALQDFLATVAPLWK